MPRLSVIIVSSRRVISLQRDELKSKISGLDNQLEKISGKLKAEEAKCRELENRLKIKESEWKMDKAVLEEKAKAVSFIYYVQV